MTTRPLAPVLAAWLAAMPFTAGAEEMESEFAVDTLAPYLSEKTAKAREVDSGHEMRMISIQEATQTRSQAISLATGIAARQDESQREIVRNVK